MLSKKIPCSFGKAQMGQLEHSLAMYTIKELTGK